MPSPQTVRAGAAYVELYTKDNRLVRGLQMAQRRLKAFGTGAQQLGMKLLKLTAAMATPLVAGVKVFADFEQQMANVSTMLDEPAKYMDTFRRRIREMSIEFGESTSTLAGGLYDILSASVHPSKALDVLAVAAKAAKAGITDTATAADAITTVLNSYGLSADHAADVSDLLFQVVKKGKTNFGELAPNIGKTASIAATAGLGLDELGASIAVLTRNGLDTEQAMTAVNAILSSFLKPSAEGATLARQLGFELNAATIQSEGLAGVFERISQLPPEAIATLFPNIRALKGVFPALKNIEGFSQDVKSMADRAGATETAYAKMTRMIAHAFAQVKQAGLVMLSVIGEALAESLSVFAKRIKGITTTVGAWIGQNNKGITTTVGAWIGQNKQLVITAAKIVGVVAAAGAALVALGVAAKMVAFVFGGIATIITGIGSAIGILGTAVATVMTLLGTLLTPIGAVIAAVAGLAGYIVYASGAGGKALTWLGSVFEHLRDTALAAFQGISDALAAGDIGLAAKILWLTLKMEWKRGVGFLKEKWIGFKEAFTAVATEMVYETARRLTQGWAMLQRAWAHTVSFMSKLWLKFKNEVVSGWQSAQGAIETAMAGAAEWLGLVEEGTSEQLESIQKARRKKREDQLRKDLATIESDKGQRLAEITAEETGTLAELRNMTDAAHAKRARQFQAELAAAREEVEKAKAEWESALGEAAEKRAAIAGPGEAPGALESPDDIVAKAKKAMAGVDLADVAKRTIGVTGTFSAMAAGHLGAGGPIDRIEENTRQIAKQGKELLKKAKPTAAATPARTSSWSTTSAAPTTT